MSAADPAIKPTAMIYCDWLSFPFSASRVALNGKKVCLVFSVVLCNAKKLSESSFVQESGYSTTSADNCSDLRVTLIVTDTLLRIHAPTFWYVLLMCLSSVMFWSCCCIFYEAVDMKCLFCPNTWLSSVFSITRKPISTFSLGIAYLLSLYK